MHPVHLVQTICALSFLGYGLSCLCAPHMAAEFRRYGIPQYRVLTGALQTLAAVGLLIGFWQPWLGGLAAAGLALQMLCGLALRVHIGDPWFKCLPATIFAVLCSWLALQLL